MLILMRRFRLDLCRKGGLDISDSLHSLALCFTSRYEKQVSIADLEEAITFCRPPGHSDRAMAFNNLASNLRRRFLRLRTNPVNIEVISLHRSALDLRPEGHRWFLLTELSVSLCYRYDKQSSVVELEEAITLGRTALELRPPDYFHRARPFINLGNALRRRFLKLGANADLEEAISFNQSALNLRPPGHQNRSDSLHSLALCFSHRCDKQASMADLEEAITLSRAALELRSPSHCDRASTLTTLLMTCGAGF